MGVGGGDKQQQKNFPQEIIDKKHIRTDSGQKIYAQGGKKKRFPPYMYKKKIMHLLKSPLLHIHPHRPPPSPISLF